MTIDTTTGGVRRRVGAAAVILAFHVLFAGLLLRPLPSMRQSTTVAAMTLFARPASQASPAVDPDVPIDARLVVPQIEIAAPPPRVPLVCDLPTTLAAVLRADPATVAALVPRAAESTHAIMAWNGAWSGEAQIGRVNHVVLSALATTPADCLDEKLVGPRLVFVPVGGSTVIISFGSGSWSWRKLLSNDG